MMICLSCLFLYFLSSSLFHSFQLNLFSFLVSLACFELFCGFKCSSVVTSTHMLYLALLTIKCYKLFLTPFQEVKLFECYKSYLALFLALVMVKHYYASRAPISYLKPSSVHFVHFTISKLFQVVQVSVSLPFEVSSFYISHSHLHSIVIGIIFNIPSGLVFLQFFYQFYYFLVSFHTSIDLWLVVDARERWLLLGLLSPSRVFRSKVFSTQELFLLNAFIVRKHQTITTPLFVINLQRLSVLQIFEPSRTLLSLLSSESKVGRLLSFQGTYYPHLIRMLYVNMHSIVVGVTF